MPAPAFAGTGCDRQPENLKKHWIPAFADDGKKTGSVHVSDTTGLVVSR